MWDGLNVSRETMERGCTISAIPNPIVFTYQYQDSNSQSLSIGADYRTIKTDWVLLSIAFDYRQRIIDSQLLLGL